MINCIRRSQDSSVLYTGSDDGAIYLWEVSDGTRHDLLGHESRVTSIALSDSAILSGGEDCTLKI